MFAQLNTHTMKKTFVAIIFVLFSWISCNSQENKFDFGFNLFPNYSIQYGIPDLGLLEKLKPSISANLFLEYKFSKKSIFGIGAGYKNNGYRTKKIDLFSIDPLVPNQMRFIYNHHNIEMPIYYRHNFFSRFFILVGMSGLVNISNTSTSIRYFSNEETEKNTQEDSSTEFRVFNFSGNLGVGMNYLSNDNISLFILPNIQYGFLGIDKNSTQKILNVGLSTGIRF